MINQNRFSSLLSSQRPPSKIEHFHTQANYDDQEKANMIPFGLEEKALDFYKGTSAQIQGNYKQIKTEMVGHFKSTKSEMWLWEELCSVKKRSHLSVK